MAEQLIGFLVVLIIFAIIAYGLYWVCIKFALPQPVLWLCGAILLIIILIYAAHTFGGSLRFPGSSG
jgi:predicted metal-binding membrane protein